MPNSAITRTRRAINARYSSRPNSGATRTELRAVAKALPFEMRDAWLKFLDRPHKGGDGLAALNVEEIFALLYASRWCSAWDRSIEEYLAEFGAAAGREVLP